MSDKADGLIAEARKHLAAMQESERAAGFASPEDLPPDMELRTALEAIKAGLATDSWSCVAEGFVMVEHAEKKIRGRFGTSKTVRFN